MNLGTWEHKARMMEMAKTQSDAEKANAAFEEGKHHIGDFLPPEELNKFMNKYKVSKSSMYTHIYVTYCLTVRLCCKLIETDEMFALANYFTSLGVTQ